MNAPCRTGGWWDAHNHLQDERFGGRQETLIAEAADAGVEAMVVNGSCEADWPQVLALASKNPRVIPSVGYHPWYVPERSPHWKERLITCLEEGRAAVGEIGLDRWKQGLAYDGQEEVFLAQMAVASDRDLPVTVHCLEAWGRLLELLRNGPRARRGFLLHSYGGSAELVPELVRLGAYFGFPGYFLGERKQRQRETFRRIPIERLLVETDAPDQCLPEALDRWRLGDASGRRINHPANLRAVIEGLAAWLGMEVAALGTRTAENARVLFGGLGSQGLRDVVPRSLG